MQMKSHDREVIRVQYLFSYLENKGTQYALHNLI